MKHLSNSEKANILIQALPYIKKYLGKVVVIKYGGHAMSDPELKKAVMDDLVLLSLVGIQVVLVHGGGPDINEVMEQMNLEPTFIDGLRYTDEKTADIVQMVLSGKTNKDLVKLLGCAGGKAVGISGLDGGMLTAKKLVGKHDLGFVGEIIQVDPTIIQDQLKDGYIPVIATVGGDSEGNVYNINADTVAAYIAGALGAENLLLMTDVRGLLRDKDDDDTLFSQVNISDVPSLVREGIISGGMIPKIESCVHAVRQGVPSSIIIDGRIPHSILIELMTDEGIGTMFTTNR